MKERNLIIIAPKTVSANCGVSDYAYQLAKQLQSLYHTVLIGVETMSAIKNSGGVAFSEWGEAINHAITSGCEYDVLINYTPISYGVAGISLKLINFLIKFKKANKSNRVFTLFHETWNGNPNLKIHHLLKDKFSKWTSGKIVKLSNGIAVVTEEQKQKLAVMYDKDKISLLPVGANIFPDESQAGFNSKRNKGVWIIFGLSHTRLWALKAYLDTIKQLVAADVINQIRSIGPKDDQYAKEEAAIANEHLNGVLIQVGSLSPAELSKELLSAEGAFVSQSADSLKKSGTFAAMVAHALPVVCKAESNSTGLLVSNIFKPAELIANPDIINEEEGYQRRIKLHQWYNSKCSWDAISGHIVNWMKASA